MNTPEHHVLICTGSKLAGDKLGTCSTRNAKALVGKLMEELEDRELSGQVIVSATSCFGICDKGPIMVVYPEGVWYGNLDAEAIEEIAEKHLEEGEPVEAYRI